MWTSFRELCVIAVCAIWCLAGRSHPATVKPPVPNLSGMSATDGSLLVDGVSLNGLAPQDPVLDPSGSVSGFWSGLGSFSNVTGGTTPENVTHGNSSGSTPFAGAGLSSLHDIVNMISGGGPTAGETVTTGAPTGLMFSQGGAGGGSSLIDSLLGSLGVTSTAGTDVVHFAPGGLGTPPPLSTTTSPNTLVDLLKSFGPDAVPPARGQTSQQKMMQQMMMLLLMMREGALEL